MKNFLLNLTFATLLLNVGYSQCDEFNWESYDPWDMQYCDLSGADLSGVDLTGADLTGADLFGADLSGAALIGADLSGTNLSDADLSGADLSGAALAGADLSGADLDGTNFSGVNLCNLSSSGYGECEELSGITDENGDGYDDVSFAAGAASVDANNDGLVDAFPTLSIINGNAIVLIQGTLDEYTDSGASCSDQEDGNISQNVEVSGQVVNMNIPGTYTVSYDCSDSDGNAAQTKSRTVFVLGSLIADENGDGFDDDAFLAGAQSGDISGNGTLNITDIIMYIELIINAD